MVSDILVNVKTASGAPVKGAAVSVVELGRTEATNHLGAARFPMVAPGKYTITAQKNGFRAPRDPKSLSSPADRAQIAAAVIANTSNQFNIRLVVQRVSLFYIDIEHAKVVNDNAVYQESHMNSALRALRTVVPAATGSRQWYGSMDYQPTPWPILPSPTYMETTLAFVISGNVSQWVDYASGTPSLEPLKKLLRTTSIPVVAICGGHQLVAKALNSDDSAVDHVNFAAKGMDPETENGKTVPISLTAAGKKDPIYSGVTPVFREFHRDEVNKLYNSAVVLGNTAFSHNQSLRYDRNHAGACLMYTSQFHPEQDEAGHRNGADYLRNFFTLARNWWFTRE